MFCIHCGQKLREEDVYCQNPNCKQILPWRRGMPIPPPMKQEKSESSDKVISIRTRKEAAAEKEAAVTIEPGADNGENSGGKKKGWSKKKTAIAAVVGISVLGIYSNYHNSQSSLASLFNRNTEKGSEDHTIKYADADSSDATSMGTSSESEKEMLTLSADEITLNHSQETMDLSAGGAATEENSGVWYSENQDIAQVSLLMDDSGSTDGTKARVTAIAGGETVIHFVSGDYETTCRVSCDFSDIHTYDYIQADSGCTWQNAYDDCQARGGHLLTINSDEEYSYIKSMLEDGGNQNKVIYLGGLRQNETSYYWNVAGTNEGENLNDSVSWGYGCWMNGEPSYKDGDVEERYMSMFYYSGENRWVWNDSPEDLTAYFPDKVGYICEYE